MLGSNKWARLVFTLAVLLNLFIAPWWLTFAWCVVGCLLFPVYLEAVIFMVFVDAVFAAGSTPTLTVLIIVTVVLANLVIYYTGRHVDFS